MVNKTEIALDKFKSGYNCAQSVLFAYCQELGMDKNTALKLSCGFGAGLGRKQETCGAVSGAIMVLGFKHGRGLVDDKSATDNTYTKTRELIDRFIKEQGSTQCRTLLNGCDLLTEAGQKTFKEKDLFNTRCVKCVESAVNILEEIL